MMCNSVGAYSIKDIYILHKPLHISKGSDITKGDIYH